MNYTPKKILITGTAGFIGFHLVKLLSEQDVTITGLDNINGYYDTQLKIDRLSETGIDINDSSETIQSTKYKNYRFLKLDVTDTEKISKLFKEEKFDTVVHLAAQAGVRYSITNPEIYVHSNIIGFLNILECCKNNDVRHLIYASSSSVYGNNEKVPFSETDSVDFPVSMYAATKKSNELMAHTYNHVHKLPSTGLRFFTVYGPWGRPDMAPYLFTKSIMDEIPIKVFNNGDLYRDFTYIDDIVCGIQKVVLAGPNSQGYAVYNIGNNKPVHLLEFINVIEKFTGKTAVKKWLPMQPGDVYKTYADISALSEAVGYKPEIDIDEGIEKYVKWFKEYYK
ncbi:MAG: GDP-mannose 4,6-dehydratase [Bacteroidetes bacterium]|nr:GDP-mannose 4,6-dehydratase [Bacteroidota bacterium]